MYNIYKDDKLLTSTSNKYFTYDNLDSETEFLLGVSSVVNGVESEITSITAMTDALPIQPAFNVHVIDTGDKYIEIEWDCDAPIGTAFFNIYVDDRLVESGFIGRRHVITDLDPLTEYEIGVSGTRDGQETNKVSILASTHAPIGDDEPKIPEHDELDNLSDPIGDFETLGENGMPVGWEYVGDNATLELTDEWTIHGNKSLKLTSHKVDMTPMLDSKIPISKGKYIAIVNYKQPKSFDVEIEGVNHTSHDSILAFGDAFVQRGVDEEGILFGLHEADAERTIDLTIAGRSLDINGADSYFYFDALRIYSISDELYSYIKSGKMHRDRIEEVFPYISAEQDISAYHTGGGWYDLPNGERVRGKENAERVLLDD